MALPAPSELTTYLGTGAKAAKFQFADSTNSPSAATREVWISHCPGVYDSSVLNPPGRCYASDTATGGSALALNWFAAPGTDPAYDDQIANAAGICEACATNGPWYVNVRYSP